MARRSGQVGYEEVKRGWFHMRFRMYVPGREKWMRSSQADLREQPLTLTDAVVEIVRAARGGLEANKTSGRRRSVFFLDSFYRTYQDLRSSRIPASVRC
jgi:hypothetical protein